MNQREQGEILFIAWIEALEALHKEAQKTQGKSLLQKNREDLVCNPAKTVLALMGEQPLPGLSKLDWDSASNLSFLKTSGKLYRKFVEKQATYYSGAQHFKSKFLIYKRFNSNVLDKSIPQNSKGQPISGLHGVTEILYSPQANLPKAGKRVLYSHSGPVLDSSESDEENKMLVGENLTLTELIPLGSKGFYLFCSKQQREPHKIQQGENLRMVIGPSGKGMRIRMAHLLRKLCHGKPEETLIMLEKIEECIAGNLLDQLQEILTKVDDPKDYYNQEIQELQILQKKWDKDLLNGTDHHLNWGLKIFMSPNTINNCGGEDNCLLLQFGTAGAHEAEVENQLVDIWKALTVSTTPKGKSKKSR